MNKAMVLLAILIIACLPLAQPTSAAPDKTIEKSFPAKMGGKLDVDLDTGGSIGITGWNKEEVAVTVEIGGDDADKVDVAFDNGSSGLAIHSTCGKRRHCDCNLRFTIKVPEKFDIAVDTKGGGVDIDGVAGAISGETMGGALKLARIKGTIHLETMGGSVTVRDSEADGEVSTMGGSVLIRDVKGNLKGKTMGGKVTYKNVTGRSAGSGKEEVSVSTMGGDIELDNAGQKVRAKTYGGDIDVTKSEEANVTTMGGDITIDVAPAGAKATTMGGDITVGSAGQYVKAKTMGGDIEIDAVDGWVEASTMGGDVTVTMVGDPAKGRRDVTLQSMGGDVTLTVPGGLSMKFDIDIEYTKESRAKRRIESDFKMNIEETPEWERHHGSPRKHIYGTGTVGGGENLIKIKTINGNVILKKG
jgi:DUF4097 and DUF4098 domain-containing protein YvlB